MTVPHQTQRMDEELKGLKKGFSPEKGCDGGNEGLREEALA